MAEAAAAAAAIKARLGPTARFKADKAGKKKARRRGGAGAAGTTTAAGGGAGDGHHRGVKASAGDEVGAGELKGGGLEVCLQSALLCAPLFPVFHHLLFS